MKTATELARELPAGPDLDALFFETCWGWVRCDKSDVVLVPHWIDDEGCVAFEPDSVSTDPAACDAWAMRWALEKKFLFSIAQRIRDDGKTEFVVQLRQWYCEGWYVIAEAIAVDWKDAFVRACIAAADQLNLKGE